jgi:single-strand DNA-binding protein
MSVNKVILIGRLGADPELKHTPAGKAVCNLSLATDEYAGKDQPKRTEWHRVTVWGEQAESCAKFLSKGRETYVEGRLQTRSWEKDGQKRYSTDVVADRVVFIGGKPATTPADAPATREPGADDDVPY